MKQFLRFALLGCLLILSQAYSFAFVYSVINNVEALAGHSDCYKVTYTLFESMGTTDPTDDVAKGTYDCVVGTDCHGPNHIEIGNVVTEIHSTTPDSPDNYHFTVNPNPVKNSLALSYSVNDKTERTWSYALTTMQNNEVLSGKMTIEDGQIYLINTSELSPGFYFLILVSDRGEVESIKVMLVQQ